MNEMMVITLDLYELSMSQALHWALSESREQSQDGKASHDV